MTRNVEPQRAIDYSSQTAYSDPGPWAPLFEDIEATIEGVSALARNLVAHYRAHRDVLPEDSREDISLRWVESILDTDQSRHDRHPLRVERELARRVQGCCRDHALLSVAALRYHGVPARSSVGFSSYLSPSWHYDHVVVDAWLDGRWRRFDPEFDAPLPLLPDPSDLGRAPNSPFLTAAQVWLGHRAGSLDVTRFGAEEGIGVDGDWFVHSYVISEVAHRFGDELLLWDRWGAMQPDLFQAPPGDLTLADEVAHLLLKADEGDLSAEAELLDRYHEDDRLHPGSHIQSWSPHGGRYEVDLPSRTSQKLQ